MYKIMSLPARFGDAFLIEYGDPQAPHLVLIDGGTGGTRRNIQQVMNAFPADRRRLDLLVISHIDRDHLEGILALFEEGDPGFGIEDVWFNGWPHMPQNPDDEFFGSVQGEKLTQHILSLGLPWNQAFHGKAVRLPNGADEPLPKITLSGGLNITLLSPSREAMVELKPVWEKELREANLDPGFGLAPNDEPIEEEEEAFGGQDLPDVVTLSQSAFVRDQSEANASSIAFLAEYEGKTVLFAADAHADQLLASLNRISPGAPVKVDLLKISHHGSQGTTSLDLLAKVDCHNYLITTNGSIFKHPHAETIARILTGGGSEPTLIFNYHSSSNQIWDTEFLKTTHNYRTRYPASGESGIEIEL